MKNNPLFRTMIAGGALVAVALVALAAFPSGAAAQTYGGYNCAFPTVYTNGYWSCNNATVTYVPPAQYYPSPAPSYPSYPSYPALSATCYPNSQSVPTGASVQWVASPSGGNGSFSYSWTGTDGLSGSGQTATMTYYNPGTKTASVTIYSNGQSYTATCNNYVTVYNSTSYVPPTTYYPAPTYQSYPSYPSYNYYAPLAVSCVVNATYAPLGMAVTWSASATGGNGYYQYGWNGTDGIGGQGQAISYTYTSPGTKYASVTVYSNGQTLTQPCSNYVTVGAPNGVTIFGGSYGGNPNLLDIACYPDPATANVNQPINWNAEVTGGAAPYRYTWTGTDGLSGDQSSVVKYYATSGQKSAIVTVTSSDGKTGSRACSSTLTVRGAGTGAPAQQPQQPPAQTARAESSLAAASIFSLSGIPWGWLAVLIILVLFATVMYLLFNKPKI